jgi:hypothetical protein
MTRSSVLRPATISISLTEVCGHASFQALRVVLRDVYINTQRSRLHDVKEIGLHPATATGVDEVANIGMSGGDNSIERGVDLLEGLQSLELLDVRLFGPDGCLVDVVGAHGVIHVLLRCSYLQERDRYSSR